MSDDGITRSADFGDRSTGSPDSSSKKNLVYAHHVEQGTGHGPSLPPMRETLDQYGVPIQNKSEQPRLTAREHSQLNAPTINSFPDGYTSDPVPSSTLVAISTVRSKLGLGEHQLAEGHDVHLSNTWPAIRTSLREAFCEFAGTFVLILFGDGVVAQVVLSSAEKGDYQSISWCWGIGVMLGIYVAGDSGGFLNPAVTLSFCVFRGYEWKRFPIYFVSQLLGAFCAAGVVYINYINAIDAFEGGPGIRTVGLETSSAGIFCTYPAAFMTKASMFFSEFIASAILQFVIFALKDDSNPGAMGKTGSGPLFPLCMFFVIFGIGAAWGWETGYAINLARDFGPRLMSYALGYGHEVWSAGGYYFWIPMVGPFLGCLFGGFLYDLLLYTGPETPINKPWFGLKAPFENWRSSKHARSNSVQSSDLELGPGHKEFLSNNQ